MKEKFTQGEWVVDVYAAKHKLDVWAGEDRIYHNPSISDLVVDSANANLIAAAPEMYRLLVDISKSIDHCGDEIDTDFMRSSIEKLLTKARGEDA